MKPLFLLLVAGAMICSPLVPAGQDGVIGGVIRNGWSKAPIKRAIVTLRTTGPEILEALAYSESNGAFAFTGVPPGEYTLCARLSGYERACFGGGGDETGKPAPLIALSAGQRKQDVIISMLPNGSVAGTVTDPDGDAVANARVELLRPVYMRRTLRWQRADVAMTNDRGAYHLAFVQPGEYRVMAVGQYQQARRIRPEAVAGQTVQEEAYVPQFYPGVASIDAAASLTLNPGNDLKGIDFTLSTAPQLSINGVVHPPPGMEKEGFVSIQFLPEIQIGLDQGLSFAATAPDYMFQASVVEGRYRMVAFADMKGRLYRTEQLVDVGPGTGILSVTLTAGTPLTGKLIVEGESLGQHGPYTIRLTSGTDLPTNRAAPTAEVSENGTFEFPGVFPGIWDIGVTPRPPGSYVKSMRLGEDDVLTKDMKLEEGTRKPLVIVLSTKGAVLTGNVMLKDGSGPLSDIRSRLLLAPSGKYEDVGGFYRTTMSDAKGHFEFKGVTPGTYRIYAFDRLRLNEYWKPDFLKPFAEAAGDAFSLGEGARVTHDATLIIRDAGVTE